MPKKSFSRCILLLFAETVSQNYQTLKANVFIDPCYYTAIQLCELPNYDVICMTIHRTVCEISLLASKYLGITRGNEECTDDPKCLQEQTEDISVRTGIPGYWPMRMFIS